MIVTRTAKEVYHVQHTRASEQFGDTGAHTISDGCERHGLNKVAASDSDHPDLQILFANMLPSDRLDAIETHFRQVDSSAC